MAVVTVVFKSQILMEPVFKHLQMVQPIQVVEVVVKITAIIMDHRLVEQVALV